MKIKSLVFALLVCGNSAYAEVVAVVGASSPAGTLSKQEVANIFLGKNSAFPSGQEAIPMDLAEGNALREAFHTAVTGKSQVQLKAYWSRLIFSGGGRPPKVVDSTAKAKELAATNPNVITYIDKADVDSSVKVVFTP